MKRLVERISYTAKGRVRTHVEVINMSGFKKAKDVYNGKINFYRVRI